MLRKLNEQKFCGWCGHEVVYKDTWMSECPGCGYKNFLNPNPCSNIIVTRGNQVMMVRRAIEPFKGKLDFPGGFTEMEDPSMESAALRELYEEAGVSKEDIQEPRYLGSLKSPVYEWQGTEINNLSFYYVCELKDPGHIIQPDQSENSEVIWVDKDDLPNIDFAWDIDKQMLEKYFEEKTNGSTNN